MGLRASWHGDHVDHVDHVDHQQTVAAPWQFVDHVDHQLMGAMSRGQMDHVDNVDHLKTSRFNPFLRGEWALAQSHAARWAQKMWTILWTLVDHKKKPNGPRFFGLWTPSQLFVDHVDHFLAWGLYTLFVYPTVLLYYLFTLKQYKQ